MGMDLHGLDAKSEAGTYFRNNCWWWRPLWSYVESVARPVLLEEQWSGGCYNDGTEVSAEQALSIADLLDAALKSGAVEMEERKYKDELDRLPDEKCKYCKGTGTRKDMRVKNGCNVCLGKGKHRPMETQYPFGQDNVKEFSKFCRESGGFTID